MNNALTASYETKPDLYYAKARGEMLPFVPRPCDLVLDVGCGGGDFAAQLYSLGAKRVIGVEPMAGAATEAGKKLDKVITGEFGPGMDLPSGQFDAIFFLDVLEHLVAPEEALQYARTLLSPSGVIVASIPNIRHWRTMWEIVVKGEWTYRDFGILDRTHLRYFTKKSIPTLFEESGLRIQRLEGINPYYSTHRGGVSWGRFKLFNALSLGRIEDMKYLQFAVVASAT